MSSLQSHKSRPRQEAVLHSGSQRQSSLSPGLTSSSGLEPNIPTVTIPVLPSHFHETSTLSQPRIQASLPLYPESFDFGSNVNKATSPTLVSHLHQLPYTLQSSYQEESTIFDASIEKFTARGSRARQNPPQQASHKQESLDFWTQNQRNDSTSLSQPQDSSTETTSSHVGDYCLDQLPLSSYATVNDQYLSPKHAYMPIRQQASTPIPPRPSRSKSGESR